MVHLIGFWFTICYTPHMDDAKKIAIENIEKAHSYFNQILSNLTEQQICEERVDGEWTTKDVIAHLSAWNIEYLDEIDRVLHGKSTWNKLYTTEEGDDAFNEANVVSRKDWSWEKINDEYKSSHKDLINRVRELTDAEWNYTLKDEVWAATQEEAAKPVSVKSLFSLEIAGNAHEMEHAKATEKFFR